MVRPWARWYDLDLTPEVTMRALAVASLFLLLGCAAQRPGVRLAPPSGALADASAMALADQYLTRYYASHPEEATLDDWPGADHGAVDDVSPEAIGRWQAYLDEVSARLHAIDPAGLSVRARLSRAVVLEEVDAARQVRICRGELWEVRADSSWPSQAAQLASAQPVGTPAARLQALARLRGLAGMVDVQIANLREGLRLGYTANRENVEAAMAQLDAILAVPLRDSPLAKAAARDGDPAFRAEVEGLLDRDLLPAVRRYRNFLATDYFARSRAQPGVLALPNGTACYQAAVRQHLTLQVPASEIHEIGLSEVARLRREMAVLAQKSFGSRDLAALLERLRSDPGLRYGSSQEIVAAAQAASGRAWAAAPRWFARLPASRVRIEPYPEYRRVSAPADYYSSGTAASGGEGTYWINAFVPPSRSRAGLEAITFHETVPGHHLQAALARESATVPVGQWIWNSGYGEGWALYAEGLAEEMGLYLSEVDRMGRLSSEAFRAARLVVDSGMHAQGWSRQQAIDYLLANTALGPELASSEVDRYAAVPGQAVSYALGALEIRRLRAEAARALGPRFDVKAFHEAVLGAGTLPLPALRQQVEAWLAAR
jgi:uncharacterized protein (DUF885 family)